jgi:hypothetical protein
MVALVRHLREDHRAREGELQRPQIPPKVTWRDTTALVIRLKHGYEGKALGFGGDSGIVNTEISNHTPIVCRYSVVLLHGGSVPPGRGSPPTLASRGAQGSKVSPRTGCAAPAPSGRSWTQKKQEELFYDAPSSRSQVGILGESQRTIMRLSEWELYQNIMSSSSSYRKYESKSGSRQR